MPAQSQLLKRAYAAARAGDCETARRLLQGILLMDKTNEAAWMLYAGTFPDPAQRRDVLRDAIARNPDMPQVRAAYRAIRPLAPPTHAPRAPARLQPQTRLIPAVGWGLLAGALIFLMLYLFSMAGLQDENIRLRGSTRAAQNERDQAQSQLDQLQSRYDQLSAQHNGLAADYSQLDGQYRGLSAQYTSLQGEFNGLVDRYNDLSGQFSVLQSRFNALNSDYTDLSGKAVVPPYITVHQREVTLSFYKLDGSILYWTVPFDSLERDFQRGFSSREKLYNNDIELKDDWGEIYHVVDFRKYVDGNIFTRVIPDLYAQAGSDEAFIREVWHIVTQLAIYASDPDEETPRYPLETLLAGGGDCEDTSILFASMIRAAPVDWSVSLVYLNADHPGTASDPNHLAVQVDTGTTRYLVETTSPDDMTPYTTNVAGWYLKVR